MIYCTQCGKPNQETSNFCVYCGAKLFKPARAVRQQQIRNAEAAIRVSTGYVSEYQNKAANMVSAPASCWEIAVSFGKSSSANFDRALYLAQHADRYEKTIFNGKEVYQAFFHSEPQSFLAFVRLYELVGNWKSASVTINGEFADRKIVSGLNYCYGDRCRSGRSDFCYGASYMTKKPVRLSQTANQQLQQSVVELYLLQWQKLYSRQKGTSGTRSHLLYGISYVSLFRLGQSGTGNQSVAEYNSKSESVY